MPGRVHVTRFSITQLARVLTIEKAAFPHEAYDREMFVDLHRECGSLFYVVRYGRALAGYMVTCTSRQRAEVVSIAVHPRFRSRGAGTALMRQTLRRLKQLGVPRVILMVRATNVSAIDFYRRFAFQRVRRVPRYYDDHADGILYQLRLP